MPPVLFPTRLSISFFSKMYLLMLVLQRTKFPDEGDVRIEDRLLGQFANISFGLFDNSIKLGRHAPGVSQWYEYWSLCCFMH